MFDTLILFPLLTTALYYLGAHAQITSFISRISPPALDKFLRCSACSGFWYGTLCGGLGWACGWTFLGAAGPLMIPLVGLAAVTWTPLLSKRLLEALDWHEDPNGAERAALDVRAEQIERVADKLLTRFQETQAAAASAQIAPFPLPCPDCNAACPFPRAVDPE